MEYYNDIWKIVKFSKVVLLFCSFLIKNLNLIINKDFRERDFQIIFTLAKNSIVSIYPNPQ